MKAFDQNLWWCCFKYSDVDGEYPFYKRASSFYEEKQLIARKALPFIDNKTTMAADSSSTVMELLKLLQDRSDLTLLTNSAEAIHVLAQSEIKVVSTGGELNKTLSLQGRITKEIISRYHVDIMVMSCKGLDINSGRWTLMKRKLKSKDNDPSSDKLRYWLITLSLIAKLLSS